MRLTEKELRERYLKEIEDELFSEKYILFLGIPILILFSSFMIIESILYIKEEKIIGMILLFVFIPALVFSIIGIFIKKSSIKKINKQIEGNK